MERRYTFNTVISSAAGAPHLSFPSIGFNWDEARVQIGVFREGNAAIAPLSGALLSDNLFEIECNAFGDDGGCFGVCNGTNSYNPVTVHYNTARRSVTGDHPCALTNYSEGRQITNGAFSVRVEFVRHAADHFEPRRAES